MATNKIYYGKEAIKKVEEKEGRKLSYVEKRVVEEEGYVPSLYKDGKGNITFGVGQTGEFINKSFNDTFKAHLKRLRAKIPSYDSETEEVKAELMSAEYRGDVGKNHNWVKEFNAGNRFSASKEFLKNRDYLQSKDKGTGVHKRMDKIAAALSLPVSESKVYGNAPFPGLQPADVNAGNTFDVNQGTRFSPNPGTQRAYGNAPFPGLQSPQPAPVYRDERLSPNPGTQRVYGNAPVPGLQQVEPSTFSADFSPPIEFASPTTGLIDSNGNPVLDGQGEPVRTRF